MKIFIKTLILAVLPIISLSGYTNLSPAEVHNRLVARDTLILLDVRENYEYKDGHIAEPEGQLPLTPVNLPMNSMVLTAEYSRLPKGIDIIVYCQSGGRSASAAKFLESVGFTQIYNMTGGFSSWSYESRKSEYGDHTGEWVNMLDFEPEVIINIYNNDTNKIVFPRSALQDINEPYYIEVHAVAPSSVKLPDLPASDSKGVFRITCLDQYGIDQFTGDSLTLADTVNISLVPVDHESCNDYSNLCLHGLINGRFWHQIPHQTDHSALVSSVTTLRKWYSIDCQNSTDISENFEQVRKGVRIYPNPFNNELKIIAPNTVKITIYDIRGRLVEKLSGTSWVPAEKYRSGIYYIKMDYPGSSNIKKVTYLK